jgi:protein O-mannosyl-transferase
MLHSEPTENAGTNSAARTYFAGKPSFLAFVLVILTIVAYSPAFRAGFIWDDEDHLTRNAAVQSVCGLKQIWSSLEVSRYYPLTLTSFWAQYRLWGLWPLPYHAVNIVLQAANSILLWILLRRLQVPGAWMAAALWAIHPVNVETVAWVTELKNTQSGFFLLLALLLFLRFEDGLRRRDYVLAIACGAAAMLSKPSTVVLPVVLLLLAWWRRGSCIRKDILRAAPLILLAAGMSLLTVIEQGYHIAGEGTAEWTLTFGQRLALATRAPWFYAGKVFWPWNVCFIYPRWDLRVDSVLTWVPLAGLFLAGGMLWRFRGRWWARGAIFGLRCYIVALLPVLGFFNIYFFRYSFVADHFQYLGSAAMIALSVAGVMRLRQRVALSSVVINRWTGALVLVALMAWSIRESVTYSSAESLYRATISRNPECWLAYNNLGATLLERGQLDDAIHNLQSGLRYRPDDGGVHNNLGTAFFRQGKIAEAVDQYREAVKLKPDYPEGHYNLGNALSQLNHLDEAVAQYREAIRLNPGYAEAHYNLANTLMLQHQAVEAAQHYQLAVRLQPNDPDMRYSLANVLAQQGDITNAVSNYLIAVQLKPDFADAYYNLANSLAQLGRIPEAIASYRRAVELNPALLPAQFNFANVLLANGNAAESIEHFHRAIALNPGFPLTYYKLGIASARLGRFDDATNNCEQALRLHEDSPDALADCAWLLATHAATTPQDAARALSFAERACQLTHNTDPSCLATLAAAYASTRQFTNAVATIDAALRLVGESNAAQNHLPFPDQRNAYLAGQSYTITLPASLPSDW